MAALVSQVEELVETAEMSCTMMQVTQTWLSRLDSCAVCPDLSECAAPSCECDHAAVPSLLCLMCHVPWPACLNAMHGVRAGAAYYWHVC